MRCSTVWNRLRPVVRAVCDESVVVGPGARAPNGKRVVMPVIESSIPGCAAERARRQPDDIAYTFIDYEVDPAGLPKA